MNIGIGTLLIFWFPSGLIFWGGFVLFRFGFRCRGDSGDRTATPEVGATASRDSGDDSFGALKAPAHAAGNAGRGARPSWNAVTPGSR